MCTTIVGLLTLIFIFIWYLKKRNDYWKDRTIPYEEATLLVGNMWDNLRGRKHIGEVFDHFYKKFNNAKYCGILNFGMPTLLVRDPELIERILIKDFSKFHDNAIFIDEKRDAVLSKNAFFAKGDMWKVVRNQVVPQISPLKVKNMYPLMVDVKDRFINYLQKESDVKGKQGIDVKKLVNTYTSEIVASCAFGLYGNCFNDDTSEFVQLGQNVLTDSTIDFVITVLAAMFPIIYKIRPPQFLSPKRTEKFKQIILSTVKERQEKNIKRGDFLDSIMELKGKTTNVEYNEDYMTAHAISFSIDGSITSAITLQFALYELAKNRDIQQRLRKEFEIALQENNGELSYDKLQEIDYLEMVIYEALRIHTPFFLMQKECTETTTLPPAKDGGSPFTLEKGTLIAIPILSLHKDPRYYEDPEEFKPERFSAEAKNSRPKMSFLGFGDGPRICLGRKFALATLKVALFGIITNFNVEINEKTPKKLELDPTKFFYEIKGTMWLKFHPIQRSF